jgi:putative transposase
MKLIAQVQLQPTSEQADALRRTLEQPNAACDAISNHAWNAQTFRQFDLHHLCYYTIKDTFNLSAQMTVRCIAKVADAYKLHRAAKRSFRPHGSIAYDDKLLTWAMDAQHVSIWTVDGRLKDVPFVAGERQLALLAARRGETDLVYRRGKFYLLAVCDIAEPTPDEVDPVLGVDLGIVNIAADSDGVTHSGAVIERVRQRHQRRRDRLQAVGTKSAKRRLKQNSGRQRRFQTDTNHRIAKQLVAKAKRTARGIAVEELTHIRQRTKASSRQQRAKYSNWAFRQLRTFLHDKAALAGVMIVAVDPRYTSQACNRCGCVDQRNRLDQATFRCVGCGHTNLADLNAAANIRDRAVVNLPMASSLRA